MNLRHLEHGACVITFFVIGLTCPDWPADNDLLRSGLVGSGPTGSGPTQVQEK